MSAAPDRLRLTDASIRLDSMPPTGRELKLTVGEAERQQLAQQVQVDAIEHLEIALNAVKFRGGMRVTGRLSAVVVQPSVVTFEPVRQVIGEPIDRVFLPTSDRSYAQAADAEIFVDPDGEDVPDHFEGPEADLTDLIVETLSLAIDPYPRGAGESLGDLRVKLDHDVDESPFARLKSLKDDSTKS